MTVYSSGNHYFVQNPTPEIEAYLRSLPGPKPHRNTPWAKQKPDGTWVLSGAAARSLP